MLEETELQESQDQAERLAVPEALAHLASLDPLELLCVVVVVVIFAGVFFVKVVVVVLLFLLLGRNSIWAVVVGGFCVSLLLGLL